MGVTRSRHVPPDESRNQSIANPLTIRDTMTSIAEEGDHHDEPQYHRLRKTQRTSRNSYAKPKVNSRYINDLVIPNIDHETSSSRYQQGCEDQRARNTLPRRHPTLQQPRPANIRYRRDMSCTKSKYIMTAVLGCERFFRALSS